MVDYFQQKVCSFHWAEWLKKMSCNRHFFMETVMLLFWQQNNLASSVNLAISSWFDCWGKDPAFPFTEMLYRCMEQREIGAKEADASAQPPPSKISGGILKKEWSWTEPCTQARTHTLTHSRKHTHTHSHTHTLTHTHTYTHTHTHTHTHNKKVSQRENNNLRGWEKGGKEEVC